MWGKKWSKVKKRDPRSKKEVRSKKVIQGQKKTCPIAYRLYLFNIWRRNFRVTDTRACRQCTNLLLVCGQHVFSQFWWHWIQTYSEALRRLQDFCGYSKKCACMCHNIGSGAPRMKAVAGTQSHTWKYTVKFVKIMICQAWISWANIWPWKLSILYTHFAKLSCTWAARSQQTWQWPSIELKMFKFIVIFNVRRKHDDRNKINLLRLFTVARAALHKNPCHPTRTCTTARWYGWLPEKIHEGLCSNLLGQLSDKPKCFLS